MRREKVFIDQKLDYICKQLPELKITLEHITTKEATKYIIEGNKNLAASITTHHLALNRNAMFLGGINPHNYCLPVLKREEHRQALLQVATSGAPKFFLGTDTAPHFTKDKVSSCGCAGVFNATYTIPILTQIFDDRSALDNLENFVSKNGANHYKVGLNKTKIYLKKFSTPISFKENLIIGSETITIFNPSFSVYWEVQNK